MITRKRSPLRGGVSLTCTLLLCFIFLQTVSATITVTDSGRRFASRPDEWVGNRFSSRYEYMARLQYLPRDPTLCSSLQNLTVTVPPDGLPVALLVRAGQCSTETKARVALNEIQPRHLVKYLIIYEQGWEDEDASLSPLPQVDQYEDDVSYKTPDVPLPTSRQSKRRHHHEEIMSFGVLHVSRLSGLGLLNTIQENVVHKQDGGPRIILDGRRESTHSRAMKRFLLWMGLSVMFLGCALSLVLSVQVQRGMLLHEAQAQGQHNRVDPRRRLTLLQVQELLPEWNYQEHDENCAAVLVRPAGQSLPLESPEQGLSLQEPLLNLEEEMCSICLDEYRQNDKCCHLPCQHTFHSSCIAKWLTERSSTCPLCKTDLFVEEEDSISSSSSSSSDEEEPTEGLSGSVISVILNVPSVGARWWQRRPWRRRTTIRTDASENGVSVEPLLVVVEQAEVSDSEGDEEDGMETSAHFPG